MRMKRMVKAVVFCVVLVLFLNHIYKIFSWKDTAGDYYSSMDSFYELEEDLVDVLFLGSSRCYCTINNAVLWEEQGISSFSLAISGQDLASSYHCFAEALKTQTPEVVCLELYGTTFHGYAVDSNMYRNTLPFRLSANAVSVVKSIAEDRQEELLLKWPIVHTRYTELKKEDFATDRPAYLGYHAEFNTQQVSPLCTYTGDEMLAIAEEEEAWIRKIIALAEENNIELCFFVAPFVSSEDDQKKYNYVEAIASEHNIPVINMPKMQDELRLDLTTDFIDWAHTNYYGSKKVSAYMAQYLKENYGLADRRGEEGFELWEENSLVRQHEYQNQMMKKTYTLQPYLDLLTDVEGYTIVLTTDGSYYADGVDLDEYVLSLGLEGYYEGLGSWIVDDGEVIHQSVGVDFLHYMELTDGDLAVSRNGGISSIVIDRQAYKKVENGINVVVYDKVLGKIVDVAGFEATRQYEMIR